MPIMDTTRRLVNAVQKLTFAPPVTHVYNPLQYAWGAHLEYLQRYARPKSHQTILLGMNPGPFGMAQTGIPFGDVKLVRDWLDIHGAIERPQNEHPKRPVLGFKCPRSEVSGSRLWGWAKDRFKTPDAFFKQFFVINYCPLCFMGETGRNITPDKLPVDEQAPLFLACAIALKEMVEYLQPHHLIGVGAFAEKRARNALGDSGPKIGRILHPSPASPAANRGWAKQAEEQLKALGIKI